MFKVPDEDELSAPQPQAAPQAVSQPSPGLAQPEQDMDVIPRENKPARVSAPVALPAAQYQDAIAEDAHQASSDMLRYGKWAALAAFVIAVGLGGLNFFPNVKAKLFRAAEENAASNEELLGGAAKKLAANFSAKERWKGDLNGIPQGLFGIGGNEVNRLAVAMIDATPEGDAAEEALLEIVLKHEAGDCQSGNDACVTASRGAARYKVSKIRTEWRAEREQQEAFDKEMSTPVVVPLLAPVTNTTASPVTTTAEATTTTTAAPVTTTTLPAIQAVRPLPPITPIAPAPEPVKAAPKAKPAKPKADSAAAQDREYLRQANEMLDRELKK